jgi:hypothetical protein
MKKIKTVTLIVAVSSSLLSIHNVLAAQNANEIGNTPPTENLQTKGEMQRALALSNRPQNIGRELLDRESDGLYGLPQQALDNWAVGRMFPSPATN